MASGAEHTGKAGVIIAAEDAGPWDKLVSKDSPRATLVCVGVLRK